MSIYIPSFKEGDMLMTKSYICWRLLSANQPAAAYYRKLSSSSFYCI